MGVCDVAADIADKIARTRAPLSREALLIHILRGTPFFRDNVCLVLWEDAYQQVAPEDNPTDTERLIDATFWLPGSFLYSDVNGAKAREYFVGTLQPLLRQFEIEVHLTGESALSDW